MVALINYKNKFSVTFFEDDFGLKAEHHFYPTAHGKSEVNGIGGSIKRINREESPRNSLNPILNAIFNFVTSCKKFSNIAFHFYDEEQYNVTLENLSERLNGVMTIVGTQKLHAFYPVTNYKVIAKPYSLSQVHRLFKLKNIDDIV